MVTKWKSILIIWTLLTTWGGVSVAGSKIVVSVAPIKSLVAQLAEGEIYINQLVSSNSTPHVFSPKPSQVQALSEADCFILMGFGLESHWSAKLINSADNPNLKVLTLDQDIDTIGDPPNPHAWISIPRLSKMVTFLATHLAEIDPSHSNQYQERAIQINKNFQKEHKQFQKRAKKLKNRKFIAARPVFNYIAQDYGLDQVGVIAGLHGHKPSPKKIARMINTIKKENVPVLFNIVQANDGFVNSIQEETNIDVVLIDPFGDLNNNLEIIFSALEKSN